jgi:hypothetical protein
MRILAAVPLLAFALTLNAADLAGTYKGSWTGGAGANGDFRVVLTPGESDAWKADVTFTFNGDEVKTKIVSVKAEGSKIEIVYDFDLGGNAIRSTVTGTVKGASLEGTYVSKAVADGSPVDEGTFKAARVES